MADHDHTIPVLHASRDELEALVDLLEEVLVYLDSIEALLVSLNASQS